jgi:hypothetical protein
MPEGEIEEHDQLEIAGLSAEAEQRRRKNGAQRPRNHR